MNYSETRAYLELHIAVILWGFTAILGDIIQLNALTLVWWRVFLTSLSLIAFVRLGVMLRELTSRQLLIYAGIGILVGMHWVTFYGAIKLANASVALVCLATTSIFSSIIEPIIVGRKFMWYELLVGIFILPGIWLIVDGIEPNMYEGIIVGLISSALVATFTSLNKRFVSGANPQRITFLELSAATLFLAPLLPYFGGQFWPSATDWVWLIILALFCTTLTNFLFLRSLSKLSAFTTTLNVNLEPVYGIILAYFLLDDSEDLNPGFYFGTIIIMFVVFSYATIRWYYRKKKKKKV